MNELLAKRGAVALIHCSVFWLVSHVGFESVTRESFLFVFYGYLLLVFLSQQKFQMGSKQQLLWCQDSQCLILPPQPATEKKKSKNPSMSYSERSKDAVTFVLSRKAITLKRIIEFMCTAFIELG